MKRVLQALVVATLCGVGLIGCGEDQDSAATRLRAAMELEEDPNVKNLYWPMNHVLYVGVTDDGAPKDEYAIDICWILRQHDLRHVHVRVVDAETMRPPRSIDYWRVLGDVRCWKVYRS